MRLVLKDKNKTVLRLDRGKELISGLENWCRKNKIKGAYFFAIGSTQGLTLSYYNLNTKKYQDKHFKEKLEIISLFGNVAWCGQELIIHAHASFSDPKMAMVGGHVKRLVVGATCEVVLEKFNKKLERALSENGLKSLK